MAVQEQVAWDDLLGRCKAGQTQARDDLCRELAVRLRLILQYRLWGWSRQDLEDIVQECLVTILQKLDRIESSPQKYACEVLRNKVGDALRRRQSGTVPLRSDTALGSDPAERGFVPAIHPEEAEGFVARFEARDRVERVQRAIMQLSAFCRLFFLGILEERSVQELWLFFQQIEPGLQRSAFDKRIFDCRRKLRRLVSDRS